MYLEYYRVMEYHRVLGILSCTLNIIVYLEYYRVLLIFQQRNDGGGCATMRERPESVETPGTYVTK